MCNDISNFVKTWVSRKLKFMVDWNNKKCFKSDSGSVALKNNTWGIARNIGSGGIEKSHSCKWAKWIQWHALPHIQQSTQQRNKGYYPNLHGWDFSIPPLPEYPTRYPKFIPYWTELSSQYQRRLHAIYIQLLKSYVIVIIPCGHCTIFPSWASGYITIRRRSDYIIG